MGAYTCACIHVHVHCMCVQVTSDVLASLPSACIYVMHLHADTYRSVQLHTLSTCIYIHMYIMYM